MCKLSAIIAVSLVSVAAASFTLPVRADECQLKEVASLDLTDFGYRPLVPVTIEGQGALMLVDTGTPISALDPRAVRSLNLITRRMFQGMMINSRGKSFDAVADLKTFAIGNLTAQDKRFLVDPDPITGDSRVAGLLGADFLRNYDFDIDFAAKKLDVFDQDHCPGKVIYWPAGAVAVVPMHVENSGHIVVPVTLDGQQIDALFDTGTSHTILWASAATQYFNLSPNSPGMQLVSKAGDAPPIYRRQFKSLSLEGIMISDPIVDIVENEAGQAIQEDAPTGSRISSAGEENGVTSMILGMRELQNLHIFVSYKEQKLYVTAPTPSATAPSSP